MSSRSAPIRTEQGTTAWPERFRGPNERCTCTARPSRSLAGGTRDAQYIVTLAYYLASHPPLVLLVVAPLWSLWLLSFIDWLRGDVLAWAPNTAATEDSG